MDAETPALKLKPARRRRALWFVLGVIGTVLLSFGGIFLDAWIRAGRRIEKERKDIHERIAALRTERVLRPAYFEPEEEGNSWTPLLSAIEGIATLTLMEKEFFVQLKEDETTPPDREGAERAIARLAPHVDALKAALRRRWTESDPPFEKLYSAPTPYISNSILASRFLTDVAAMRHEDGKGEEAVDLFTMTFGLADRVSIKGALIACLVEIVISEIALTKLRLLLGDHRFDPAGLARLQQALERYHDHRKDMIECFRIDDVGARTVVLEFADESGAAGLAQNDIRGAMWRDFFSARLTCARFLRTQDQVMTDLERLKGLSYRRRQEELKALYDRTVTPPNVLHMFLIPQFGRAYRNDAVNYQKLSLGRMAVALARYREKEGAFPGKLSFLVPEYLPSLPVDSIDGHPWGYRAAGDSALLYAWGDDGDDDGGKSVEGDEFDEGLDGDIVWTIKRANGGAK